MIIAVLKVCCDGAANHLYEFNQHNNKCERYKNTFLYLCIFVMCMPVYICLLSLTHCGNVPFFLRYSDVDMFALY